MAATFVQRMTGDGLQGFDQTLPENQKISIDLFLRSVRLLTRGVFTTQQVLNQFSLDATQTIQAAAMLNWITSGPTELDKDNRFEFMDDLFYVAENRDSPVGASWVMDEWDLRNDRVPTV